MKSLIHNPWRSALQLAVLIAVVTLFATGNAVAGVLHRACRSRRHRRRCPRN